MKTPGVGEDIEDICGRCGDTWHVVMAKIGDKVAKVVCRRCGSQHNYKSGNNSPAGDRTRRTTGIARRKTTKTQAIPAPPPEFDPTKPPRPYGARDTYQVGERIDHPRFGVGVVTALPGPGKIDVAFSDAPRTLACARDAPTLSRPSQTAEVPIADRPPDKP